ncbi:MAG: CRISPR system precrRNA processing endoribonuclease RAMP protein Cas6 [Deltaproteobacteria bacterium]|nr:CRISPR system precrRNA processing endoribonuclease RAMP protein Cas6 [Deltaproteobacteria bacterium]MBW2123450.1 CRISPR system precrRNA processing endoribonuclease RAMP protein Cas6 [Deltaproteobacteria bacterium]
MPHSVVFHCVAEQDLDGDLLRGRGMLDLAFQLFGRVDPRLTASMVEGKEKPFTVSPFFAKRWPSGPRAGYEGVDPLLRGRSSIRAGTPCRFRITLLEDRLFQSMAGLIGDSGLVLSVGGRPLRVGHIISSSQPSDPWPRSQSYAQLNEEASSTSRELRLQFVTPTVFKRQGMALPLPDPQMVFRGFLRSWKWFAFIPLSSDLESFLDSHVVLKDFRISRTTFDTGERVEPSFTGWGRFVLAGRHHERHIKEFNLLGDYSFYCGTGAYRERGMGMTRRL